MPDNELDVKRLLIPMTPFLICWSLNWMKSRRALLAASIRASFFDFPWPTYFWPSTWIHRGEREIVIERGKKKRNTKKRTAINHSPSQTSWTRAHGKDLLATPARRRDSSWVRWELRRHSLAVALDSTILSRFPCAAFETMLYRWTKKKKTEITTAIDPKKESIFVLGGG